MTCALTGKLAFNEADIGGSEGQEVFSERKGLNLFQNKVSPFSPPPFPPGPCARAGSLVHALPWTRYAPENALYGKKF